jgi:hypothetical protein
VGEVGWFSTRLFGSGIDIDCIFFFHLLEPIKKAIKKLWTLCPCKKEEYVLIVFAAVWDCCVRAYIFHTAMRVNAKVEKERQQLWLDKLNAQQHRLVNTMLLNKAQCTEYVCGLDYVFVFVFLTAVTVFVTVTVVLWPFPCNRVTKQEVWDLGI